MKWLIGVKTAGNALLIALGALAVFHVLVAVGLFPADILWGGRATDSPGHLLVLELTGLIVTLLFALVIAIRVGNLKTFRFNKLARVGTWIVFVFFILTQYCSFFQKSENISFNPLKSLTNISFRLK